MNLIIKDLCKKINNKIILKNISFSLKNENVYGFVGRNGSGKTMLFRAIAALMSYDSGEISLDDKILHKDMDVLPSLGIIIENAGLYPELTGFKNLEILAGINKKISSDDIKDAIIRVGLDPNDKRSFRKYSLGMKQRIIIAQAIMEKPDIIMLDEPTNALDEEGVDLIRKIIKEEKERGALILLASHNKEDIKMLADKVFYLSGGELEEENKNE